MSAAQATQLRHRLSAISARDLVDRTLTPGEAELALQIIGAADRFIASYPKPERERTDWEWYAERLREAMVAA